MTGKGAFQVLHRHEIDQAMDQMRNRQGEDWDRATMAILDRWRTAQVVVDGRLDDHCVREEVVDETVVDREGRQQVVRVRRCSAQVRAQLRATDVAGKRLLDEVTLQGSSSACTRAERGEPDRVDHQQLLATARGQVLANYLQRVLPHQVWVHVALYQDGDFPDLQVGNGFAEAGNWTAAVESYQRALAAMTGELAGYRHKALFNLGVAYEFTDRFAEARQTLQEAYAIGRDSMILEELQRVEVREQEVRRLRQQSGQPAMPAK
jgi:tetratricopeptide (TPR) repeat protein